MLPTVIIIYLLYYIITKNIIIDFIKNNFDKTIQNSIEIILTLPIYKIIMEITNQILFYHLIYLIIILILFFTFFFLLKKELKNNI